MGHQAALKEKLADNHAAQFIRESGNQIWLAGLGAYARAGEEGREIFETLVAQGEELESRTRDEIIRQVKATEETFGALKEKAGAGLEKVRDRYEEKLAPVLERARAEAGRAREKAETALERVERVFDTRVSGALARLGVPSATAVSELNRKLDELEARIQRLE